MGSPSLRILLLTGLAAAAISFPATGQTPTDTTPPAPIGAPVIVGGDTLFLLYGRLGPFSPAQRAAAVSQRLHQHRPPSPRAATPCGSRRWRATARSRRATKS